MGAPHAATLPAPPRLLWTTEKETLWILKNAGLFGTAAGDVYQARPQPAPGCALPAPCLLHTQAPAAAMPAACARK